MTKLGRPSHHFYRSTVNTADGTTLEGLSIGPCRNCAPGHCNETSLTVMDGGRSAANEYGSGPWIAPAHSSFKKPQSSTMSQRPRMDTASRFEFHSGTPAYDRCPARGRIDPVDARAVAELSQ